jgi:hypothetical protein
MEEFFFRRIAHGDDLGGRNDLGPGTDTFRPGSQLRVDQRRVTNQQHTQARIAVQRVRRAGNVLARLLVAAHHIDGDRQHAEWESQDLSIEAAYSASSTSAGFSITRLPR